MHDSSKQSGSRCIQQLKQDILIPKLPKISRHRRFHDLELSSNIIFLICLKILILEMITNKKFLKSQDKPFFEKFQPSNTKWTILMVLHKLDVLEDIDFSFFISIILKIYWHVWTCDLLGVSFGPLSKVLVVIPQIT